MENREKIKRAILTLLELGCGFEVDLFALLCIHQLEDGRYRIFNSDIGGEVLDNPYQVCDDGWEYDERTDESEEIYTDLATAVERFLQLREARQLGYDFEKDWFRNEYGGQSD